MHSWARHHLLLAGSAAAGGAGVAEEPTVSGVLTVENTAFVATSLEMDSGEVLGLFIVNKDPFPHSFDIDSLDIHVQLQPNSTTAVAIKPTGPGNLEFFCGVPGHRQAGMVGTITIGAARSSRRRGRTVSEVTIGREKMMGAIRYTREITAPSGGDRLSLQTRLAAVLFLVPAAGFGLSTPFVLGHLAREETCRPSSVSVR